MAKSIKCPYCTDGYKRRYYEKLEGVGGGQCKTVEDYYHEKCKTCDGIGYVFFVKTTWEPERWRKCNCCNGTGEIITSERYVTGVLANGQPGSWGEKTIRTRCALCKGKGEWSFAGYYIDEYVPDRTIYAPGHTPKDVQSSGCMLFVASLISIAMCLAFMLLRY